MKERNKERGRAAEVTFHSASGRELLGPDHCQLLDSSLE